MHEKMPVAYTHEILVVPITTHKTKPTSAAYAKNLLAVCVIFHQIVTRLS